MTFHKTSLKLAGFYLAVLMTISLFFSASIYQVSLNELERGLRRPTTSYTRPTGGGAAGGINTGFTEDLRQQFDDDREEAFDSAKDRILARLIIINVFILTGGGLLCYYLAARTLRPIEEAHEAQNRFTADASHELRTPITAMRSENEVALMDPKLTLANAKTQLQSNIEELEKLSTLSEGLLRLAQVDNTALTVSKVNAKDIANAAIERVLARAEKRNILITTKFAKSAVVLGDEVSATEALVTLLDNAIKYSSEKSSVLLTITKDQKMVLFSVQDTGVGIAADELPYVFERFYRADSSRTKQQIGGYGLGLAIAKSIAEAHGGTVSAQSISGKGSVFTLSLPSSS